MNVDFDIFLYRKITEKKQSKTPRPTTCSTSFTRCNQRIEKPTGSFPGLHVSERWKNQELAMFL